MGWQIDNFAHENIYKRLKNWFQNGRLQNADGFHYYMLGCTVVLCQESSEEDPMRWIWNLQQIIQMLLHGMLRPDNLATIINIEQGWKLVTTHDRMNDIIAGYMVTNKSVKVFHAVTSMISKLIVNIPHCSTSRCFLGVSGSRNLAWMIFMFVISSKYDDDYEDDSEE